MVVVSRHSSGDTVREGGGPGSGPDRCVVCGGDASHTLGRHCSCDCATVSLRQPGPDQTALVRFATDGGRQQDTGIDRDGDGA